MTKIIPGWYHERREFIDTSLEKYLNEYFENNGVLLGSVDNEGLQNFREACKYAVAGGKKLRAILALEFYLTLQKKEFSEVQFGDDIVKYCISMEFIHAFSLVHDDLPCMDNDTLRRGKETVWKKYGEYQGVLVGDVLNTLAFECLSTVSDPILALKLVNLLSRGTGYHGMVGGQVDDMFYEEHPEKLGVTSLLKLHNRKTGALIRASVQGGILCSGKIQNIHKLSSFGEKLGLAFQIKDDLLDVEGTAKETGKSVGGEEKGFVYFMGITETKKYLDDIIHDCYAMTQVLNSKHINYLIGFVKERSK